MTKTATIFPFSYWQCNRHWPQSILNVYIVIFLQILQICLWTTKQKQPFSDILQSRSFIKRQTISEWQRVTTIGTRRDNEWQRMTTNGSEWYNEWLWVRTSGTTSNNEWQRMTTNDNEWYNEWQRVIIQRVITNDSGWQRGVQQIKTNKSE